MANDNYSTEDFDELDRAIELDNSLVNNRISVRYRRHDIKATLKARSLLFSRETPVELLDISSKGAAILCDKKLKLKKRIILSVQFTDQKSFTIDAKVAHVHKAPRYGLKFERYQGELADHLLKTQTDLEFG